MHLAACWCVTLSHSSVCDMYHDFPVKTFLPMVHLAQAQQLDVYSFSKRTAVQAQQHSDNPGCCGSEEHPEIPEEALLTLIDLVTDSAVNAAELVAAAHEGAALFQRYLRTCGTAGRQVRTCRGTWMQLGA